MLANICFTILCVFWLMFAIVLVTVCIIVIKFLYKNQQSNYGGGISRTVTVYDVNGHITKQYSGKFDIETDNENYMLFDDEDGKRHIIYKTNGTITVDDN